jgi:hypothetical protein
MANLSKTQSRKRNISGLNKEGWGLSNRDYAIYVKVKNECFKWRKYKMTEGIPNKRSKIQQ